MPRFFPENPFPPQKRRGIGPPPPPPLSPIVLCHCLLPPFYIVLPVLQHTKIRVAQVSAKQENALIINLLYNKRSFCTYCTYKNARSRFNTRVIFQRKKQCACRFVFHKKSFISSIRITKSQIPG